MDKKPISLDALGNIKKPKRIEEHLSNDSNIRRRRRRSLRVVQLNLNVTNDFYDKLSLTADKEGCYMVEILEKALDRYIDT